MTAGALQLEDCMLELVEEAGARTKCRRLAHSILRQLYKRKRQPCRRRRRLEDLRRSILVQPYVHHLPLERANRLKKGGATDRRALDHDHARKARLAEPTQPFVPSMRQDLFAFLFRLDVVEPNDEATNRMLQSMLLAGGLWRGRWRASGGFDQ